MVSSGAIRPARAPPSIDMLQTVIRSSIDRARMASPVYSMTWPVPPPTPMRAIRARMMSLAPTPGLEPPVDLDPNVLGLRWSSVCVARTISISLVPMPNASAPKAPCVAVWESPQTIVMPGCVRPSSGPMTWTMPRVGRALAVERDAELAAVLLDLGQLLAGQLVDDRDRRIGRGDRMVGRGDGLAGLADLEAALAQAGERLRARDLVDEVKVDREDCRRAGFGRHDVRRPRSSLPGCAVSRPCSTRVRLPRLTADGGHRGYQMIANRRIDGALLHLSACGA